MGHSRERSRQGNTNYQNSIVDDCCRRHPKYHHHQIQLGRDKYQERVRVVDDDGTPEVFEYNLYDVFDLMTDERGKSSFG